MSSLIPSFIVGETHAELTGVDKQGGEEQLDDEFASLFATSAEGETLVPTPFSTGDGSVPSADVDQRTPQNSPGSTQQLERTAFKSHEQFPGAPLPSPLEPAASTGEATATVATAQPQGPVILTTEEKLPAQINVQQLPDTAASKSRSVLVSSKEVGLSELQPEQPSNSCHPAEPDMPVVTAAHGADVYQAMPCSRVADAADADAQVGGAGAVVPTADAHGQHLHPQKQQDQDVAGVQPAGAELRRWVGADNPPPGDTCMPERQGLTGGGNAGLIPGEAACPSAAERPMQGEQQHAQQGQVWQQAQQAETYQGRHDGGGGVEALAACSRSNLAAVLTNRRDMARLVEVDQWVQGYCTAQGLPAPPSVLSGLVVRYHACRAYHLSRVEGMQLAADGRVQLRVPEGTPSIVPLIGVSKSSVVAADDVWQQQGLQEASVLRASMQAQGGLWRVKEVGAAGWRRKVALAWLDFVAAVGGDPQEEIASLVVLLCQGGGKALARMLESVEREGPHQAQQQVQAAPRYGVLTSPHSRPVPLPSAGRGSGVVQAVLAGAAAQRAQTAPVGGQASLAGTPAALGLLGVGGSVAVSPSPQSVSLFQAPSPGLVPQPARPGPAGAAQGAVGTPAVQEGVQAAASPARLLGLQADASAMAKPAPQRAQQGQQQGQRPTRSARSDPEAALERQGRHEAPAAGNLQQQQEGGKGQRARRPIQWQPQRPQAGDTPLQASLKQAPPAAPPRPSGREGGPARIKWEPQESCPADTPLVAGTKAVRAAGSMPLAVQRTSPPSAEKPRLALSKPAGALTRTIVMDAAAEGPEEGVGHIHSGTRGGSGLAGGQGSEDVIGRAQQGGGGDEGSARGGEQLTIIMRRDDSSRRVGGEEAQGVGAAQQPLSLLQQLQHLQQQPLLSPGVGALYGEEQLGGGAGFVHPAFPSDLLSLPAHVLLAAYPPSVLQQLLEDRQRQLGQGGALGAAAGGEQGVVALPRRQQAPSPEEGELRLGEGSGRREAELKVEGRAGGDASPAKGKTPEGRQVQLDPGAPPAEAVVHLPHFKGDLEGARRHLEALSRHVVPSQAPCAAVKRACMRGLLQRGLRESRSRPGRFVQQGVVVAQVGEMLLKACRDSPQVASQYEKYGRSGRVMLLARDLRDDGVATLVETGKGRWEVVLQVDALKQLAGELQGRAGGVKRPAEAGEQLQPRPSPKVRRVVVPDPSPPRPAHMQQRQQQAPSQLAPSERRKTPEYADFWDPIWRFEHQLVMHLRREQQAPLERLRADFQLPPPHPPSCSAKYFANWIRRRPSRFAIDKDGMVGAVKGGAALLEYMRDLLEYLASKGRGRGCRVDLEDVRRGVPLPADLPRELVNQAQSNIWTFLVQHFSDALWLMAPKHYTPDRNGLRTVELRPYSVPQPHSQAPRLNGVCAYFRADCPGSCHKQEKCNFSHCLERQLL